jgi:hypothetical protein
MGWPGSTADRLGIGVRHASLLGPVDVSDRRSFLRVD